MNVKSVMSVGRKYGDKQKTPGQQAQGFGRAPYVGARLEEKKESVGEGHCHKGCQTNQHSSTTDAHSDSNTEERAPTVDVLELTNFCRRESQR